MTQPCETELLKAFETRCRALFSQVAAVKPEKGIAALLKRARKEMATNPALSLEQALDDQYVIAERLTQNRIALLGQCQPLHPINH